MYHIWIGNVNLTVAALVVSAAVVLPLQLLLCFKVRSRRLRLMPAIILFLAVAANLVMYLAVSTWKRMVFATGAIYILFMMIACGVAWTLWAIIKRGKEDA